MNRETAHGQDQTFSRYADTLLNIQALHTEQRNASTLTCGLGQKNRSTAQARF